MPLTQIKLKPTQKKRDKNHHTKNKRKNERKKSPYKKTKEKKRERKKITIQEDKRKKKEKKCMYHRFTRNKQAPMSKNSKPAQLRLGMLQKPIL